MPVPLPIRRILSGTPSITGLNGTPTYGFAVTAAGHP